MTDVERDTGQAAEPGTVSRLLKEIARAPADGGSWREPLEAGGVVGRYEIRREIGRGGFGAVYEAFDPQLGRTVALKALKPGRSKHLVSEEWIQKEAEAVAKLDHPAIVTIFDVGTCPAGAYLVMELLRGETLAKRIEKGPLPVDEALRIAEQMAEGLAHAHERGVLHRDLKPANVFVCEDGRVKLLDFGLAHLLGTEGSSGAGTPAYMAPEQAAGATVDERADVWAAGMVLGEMITGKRPVERTPTPAAGGTENQTELIWKPPAAPASPGTPPALARTPRPVAKVVGAALSEDPAARPKDGKAWLSELRSARLLVDRPRRLRRLALVGTAFLLLGLAVAGLATWRIWERQIPGGRVTVAVADFANETGEKELDGLSGLLITSLEQSAALRVLTRSRMFDVLKQLGKGDVERIDEPLAREVGRHSRVRALLLASVRKAGDAYVVEMRALDPLLDEYVFTLKDRAADRAGVFDLVDRLGSTTRSRLGTSASEDRDVPKVASITTTNLKAWDLLFQSRRALDLAKFEEAYQLAEAALAEDPESVLAVYQLDLTTGFRRAPGWDKKAAMKERREALERVADRLPEKEKMILQLDRAFDSKQPEEIDRLCERMTTAYPLDKEILLSCGTVRFHYYFADRERTIAYLERALHLDPTYELAIFKLCLVLMTLGGAEEKLDLLRQRAATATEDRQMDVLAGALFAARAEPEATAVLDRMYAKRGWKLPPVLLAIYLAHTGRPVEGERIARGCLAGIGALPEAERAGMTGGCTTVLIETLVAQGQRRSALETLASWNDLPAREGDVFRILIQASVGAIDEARAAARDLDAHGVGDDPEVGRWAANVMVESGLAREAAPHFARARASLHWEQLAHADRLAAEANASIAEGNPDAEARVRKLLEHPHLGGRYDTARLLARLLRERRACAEAVVVLEDARRVPPSVVVQARSFSQPLVLHWLSECYEKLGDLAKARERNGEHLRLWANADPDLPLLAEAKALQARLAVK